MSHTVRNHQETVDTATTVWCKPNKQHAHLLQNGKALSFTLLILYICGHENRKPLFISIQTSKVDNRQGFRPKWGRCLWYNDGWVISFIVSSQCNLRTQFITRVTEPHTNILLQILLSCKYSYNKFNATEGVSWLPRQMGEIFTLKEQRKVKALVFT